MASTSPSSGAVMRTGRAVVVALVCMVITARAAENAFAKDKGNSKKGPELSIRVTPRLSLYTVGQAVRVTVTVQIKNINEELWCPATLWDWDDGGAGPSLRESDCQPFEEVASEELESPVLFTESHIYYGPGRHTITVTLKKGDRVLRRLSV